MWRALGSAQQPLLGLAERGFRLAEPAEGPTPATPFAPLPPTPPAEADAALAALDARALAWRATPCAQRAALLRETIRTTLAAAEAAAAAGAAYKGSAAGVGDELFRWAVVAGALREYAEAMDAGGAPRPHALAARAVPAGAGSDGSGEAGADAGGAKSPQTQVVVDAFPLGLEALLFGGFRGELWLEPGAPPAQGAVYRAKAAAAAAGAAPRAGGAALVLAAGNEIAVVATDVLHVLLAVDSPVACKMNPANEVLGPHLRRAFQPLVDYGVLEFLYGGAAEGAALAADARVEALHLTGSAATFDALVWRGAPKSESAPPPFPKPVHAELGCVTPYIVCPGPWTPEELEFHAESVATGLTHNAGHNCLAAEVVVLDAEWPLRGAFLAALRRRLAAAPARAAFYPGAAAERAAFLARFPDAEALGAPGAEADLGAGPGEAARERARARPWLLKTGLAPGEAAVSAEHWCGVLQEVSLPGCGGDPRLFLPAAAAFANDRCFGTLSCALFVHPAMQKEHPAAVDAAIAELRYGSVCVNCPTTLGFGITKLGWGAHASGAHSLADIGSGNCIVHNTLLFDRVQKSVLRAPWRPRPFPFWLGAFRNGAAAARAALRFVAAPSLPALLPLAAAAARG